MSQTPSPGASPVEGKTEVDGPTPPAGPTPPDTGGGRRARSYGSGARILSIGIASARASTSTFSAFFSIASHVLGEESAQRLDVLWSVMFVVISVIYRPIEQLLSRTIAERRARGHTHHPLGIPIAIQAGFAPLFLAVALALHEQLVDKVFDGYSALYDVLIVGTLAYAASYFARGWLAGHEYFALFGGSRADGVGLADLLRDRRGAGDHQRPDGGRARDRGGAAGLAGRGAGGFCATRRGAARARALNADKDR